MLIRTVFAQNWRCWDSVRFEPGTWNVLWGKNGVGKTSILESVWAYTRSRTARNRPLATAVRRSSQNATEQQTVLSLGVSYNEQECTVLGDFDTSDGLAQVGLQLNNRGSLEKCRWNSTDIPRTHLSWRVPSILLQPADTQLFLGPPDARRDVVHRVAFAYDPAFIDLYKKFDASIKQRNQILRDRYRLDPRDWRIQLQHWDEIFVNYAAPYASTIASGFHHISGRICAILKELFPDLSIAVALENWPSQKEAPDAENMRAYWASELQKSFEKDCAKGYTSTGPQRFDWSVKFHDRKAKDAASQGQLRACALATRLALAEVTESVTKIQPIMLVDDMAGELDDIRSEYLVHWLEKNGNQVFLTTPEKRHIPYVPKDTRFWKIVDGTISND